LTLTGLLMEGLDRSSCDFQDCFRVADKPSVGMPLVGT
jgi:hypothetical protein